SGLRRTRWKLNMVGHKAPLAKSVAWFYELTPVRCLGFSSLWLESCNSLVNCWCLPESETLQYLYLTKARYGK
ncbi:hypothetical protein J6590_101801, partial [Homalodisca vitripennis]